MDREKEAFILIVDDNPKNLQVLGNILREKNHKSAIAKDGFQALKFVGKRLPDLILLDIMMPEMDGFEVCRRLKSNDASKNVPVIFISALTDTSEKLKAFEVGGVDYITKPFQKEEVFARVNAHLELRNSNKELERIGKELRQAKDHLETVYKKSEKAREAAEEANNKIMDSIRYAQMIQSSLLPNPENIKSFLPESFFIWMPRDIVGGDFIFTDAFENGFIIAVIDCTGHGVPGAFMTMIAVFALGKIIKDEGHHDPAQILKRLNFLVKTILQQDTDYALSDDGLDAAICSVRGRSFVVTDTGDRTTDYQELIFAGAKLPLAYVYKNEITIIKGDKKSIGYKKSDLGFEFANHHLTIEKGMSFYMFSDGFADQLGHEKERRFGTARFKELLRENAQLGFEKQRNVLLQAFNEYKGDTEVLDDVTVIGFRCK